MEISVWPEHIRQVTATGQSLDQARVLVRSLCYMPVMGLVSWYWGSVAISFLLGAPWSKVESCSAILGHESCFAIFFGAVKAPLRTLKFDILIFVVLVSGHVVVLILTQYGILFLSAMFVSLAWVCWQMTFVQTLVVFLLSSFVSSFVIFYATQYEIVAWQESGW